MANVSSARSNFYSCCDMTNRDAEKTAKIMGTRQRACSGIHALPVIIPASG
jgi:hypothetical protein